MELSGQEILELMRILNTVGNGRAIPTSDQTICRTIVKKLEDELNRETPQEENESDEERSSSS